MIKSVYCLLVALLVENVYFGVTAYFDFHNSSISIVLMNPLLWAIPKLLLLFALIYFINASTTPSTYEAELRVAFRKREEKTHELETKCQEQGISSITMPPSELPPLPTPPSPPDFMKIPEPPKLPADANPPKLHLAQELIDSVKADDFPDDSDEKIVKS